MQEKQSSSGITEILIILFKQKNKIIFIFSTIVISVTVATMMITPIYKSETKLLVKLGREYIFQNETGNSRTPDYFKKEDILNTEVHILTSEELIERTLNAIGVQNVYPELFEKPAPAQVIMKQAVAKFERNINIFNIRRTDLISVGYKHEDPKKAAYVLNRMVEEFIERHLQLFSNSRTDFFRDQLEVYQTRIEKTSEALRDFKEKNKVYSIKEQRTLLLRQYDSLDTVWKETMNRIQELGMILSSLDKQMDEVPENIIVSSETSTNYYVDSAMNKLLSLQLEEQQLLTKYSEGNRLVASIRKEIQLVKDFIAENEDRARENVRVGINSTYQSLENKKINSESEFTTLKVKADAIKNQLGVLEDEIKSLDTKEIMLNTLSRELLANEENYKDFQVKYEQASISEEMDRQKLANVSVVQKALVPERPISPNKRSNVMMAIILGGATSLGIALFFEFVVEQSMSTPENVERRLELPVLATIAYKGK